MATEILKKQTIVGTDAQYEANKNSYEEGTVFESTSLLGEGDIDPTYTNKFVQKRTTTGGVYLYAYDSTGDIYQSADTGANAYTVARRDAGGTLKIGTPVGQSDATTKKYVDDAISNSKISAINLTKAITSVSHDPTKGMLMSGTSELTLEDGTKKDATMNIGLPIVAGPGIDIYKYDGEEKFTVELNPSEATDLILGTSSYTQVLALGSAGIEYYELGQLIPFGAAQYTTDMKLMAYTDDEEITDPEIDTVLVNKAYANQHYVPKTTAAEVVYATDSDGVQKEIPYSDVVIGSSLALRDFSGHIYVADPTDTAHAANKAYVDSKKTYTHYIHMQRGVSSDHNYMEVFMTISGSSISTFVENLADLTALIEDVFPGPLFASATGWDTENDSPIIGTIFDFGDVGPGDLCFMEKNGYVVTVTDDFSYDDNVK